jgi:uncharacterized damage-inducible protein DinB
MYPNCRERYHKNGLSLCLVYGRLALFHPDAHALQCPVRAITEAADPWLDTLTPRDLAERRRIILDGAEIEFTFGTDLQRVIYHYWYHTGENRAIRQLLGHTNLPEFVGDIDNKAPYRPEEPEN